MNFKYMTLVLNIHMYEKRQVKKVIMPYERVYDIKQIIGIDQSGLTFISSAFIISYFPYVLYNVTLCYLIMNNK